MKCSNEIVRPGTRRGDDEGRAVTALSRGVMPQYIRHTAHFCTYCTGYLVGSVPVDSSYRSHEYGATACGNSSSDAGLGRNFGTSRSEEAVRVGSLRIHSGEGDEDEREDDDDDDDDDDGGGGDGDSDDHEHVPVIEASSSSHRDAPGKGKGLTGNFMSVMSKIAGS
ncbi:hypothetical protein M9H77_17015 [Catharanthus roseus]|uniref:Uncharacterized protein n=1 Tax=Catharanthus roseus TaxID=4058 RepID=A0ACC0B3I6_CATRO|nr:hypothetical protein M9H77_17015 [Catharanthus roseus]